MTLTAQIELMTNPQDFVRLCNMILSAEYGTAFLPIDDDRPDRGNDGYLVSEKRMFAMHCFKRVQNQSLDAEIRAKMSSDLHKAIALKSEGAWDVDAWTFISNYPIPEAVARDVQLMGKAAGIAVSWRGADYIAAVLQKAKEVHSSFPHLQVNEIMNQLNVIISRLEDDVRPAAAIDVNWVPRNVAETEGLLARQPPGWEYLHFAGALLQGRRALEPKWLDYRAGYSQPSGRYLDHEDAVRYLRGAFSDILVITEPVGAMFSVENHILAFGADGEPGNPTLIEHLAKRVLTLYEGLLDWAARIRGMNFPGEFEYAAELAANVAERPASEVRDFLDHVVEQIGRVPEILARENSEPVRIELWLKLSVDDRAIDAFNRELGKIAGKCEDI